MSEVLKYLSAILIVSGLLVPNIPSMVNIDKVIIYRNIIILYRLLCEEGREDDWMGFYGFVGRAECNGDHHLQLSQVKL